MRFVTQSLSTNFSIRLKRVKKMLKMKLFQTKKEL